jgi:hypothetical protein
MIMISLIDSYKNPKNQNELKSSNLKASKRVELSAVYATYPK